MKHRRTATGLISLALTCLALAAFAPAARAQAPAPDSYEENDTLTEAAAIPAGAELDSLTISPAGDPDWFRALIHPPAAYPGQYRVEVIGTPGLDLALTVYGPDSSPVGTNNHPSSPNAAVTFSASAEGWYAIEVLNTAVSEGWYLLRVLDLTPAPTPTPTLTPVPTATGTPQPTATLPVPTRTPTPDLGGAPDTTEPSYDFAHAYRLAPGDVFTGLNFNSGTPGAVDNDFFVMAVRYGVTYTCETRDLGPSLDTNLIVYGSADFSDVIGGNDDIHTQAGQIASRFTFTSPKEGDVYILVGYKYPQPQGLPFPGAATYTLTCFAAAPTPTPTVTGITNGGWNVTPQATPLRVELLSRPDLLPTPTPVPVVLQTVDVLVGYDRNDNDEVDPNEGVRGISVRVIDVATNRELTHSFTSVSGTVRFTVVTGAPIRVVIQYLGAAEEFRPGSPAQWTLLVPAANVPGLIP
jgi:hypothetical protein